MMIEADRIGGRLTENKQFEINGKNVLFTNRPISCQSLEPITCIASADQTKLNLQKCVHALLFLVPKSCWNQISTSHVGQIWSQECFLIKLLLFNIPLKVVQCSINLVFFCFECRFSYDAIWLPKLFNRKMEHEKVCQFNQFWFAPKIY